MIRIKIQIRMFMSVKWRWKTVVLFSWGKTFYVWNLCSLGQRHILTYNFQTLILIVVTKYKKESQNVTQDIDGWTIDFYYLCRPLYRMEIHLRRKSTISYTSVRINSFCELKYSFDEIIKLLHFGVLSTSALPPVDNFHIYGVKFPFDNMLWK